MPGVSKKKIIHSKKRQNFIQTKKAVGGSQSTSNASQFKIIIDNKPFYIKHVIGDGNCFFHAIKHYTDMDATELRTKMNKYIEDNPIELEIISEFLVHQNANNTALTPESFLKALQPNSNTWAEPVIITLIQKVLEKPIIIYDGSSGSVQSGVTLEIDSEPIYVYFNGEDHFDALVETYNDDIDTAVERVDRKIREIKKKYKTLSKKNKIEDKDAIKLLIDNEADINKAKESFTKSQDTSQHVNQYRRTSSDDMKSKIDVEILKTMYYAELEKEPKKQSRSSSQKSNSASKLQEFFQNKPVHINDSCVNIACSNNIDCENMNCGPCHKERKTCTHKWISRYDPRNDEIDLFIIARELYTGAYALQFLSCSDSWPSDYRRPSCIPERNRKWGGSSRATRPKDTNSRLMNDQDIENYMKYQAPPIIREDKGSYYLFKYGGASPDRGHIRVEKQGSPGVHYTESSNQGGRIAIKLENFNRIPNKLDLKIFNGECHTEYTFRDKYQSSSQYPHRRNAIDELWNRLPAWDNQWDHHEEIRIYNGGLYSRNEWENSSPDPQIQWNDLDLAGLESYRPRAVSRTRGTDRGRGRGRGQGSSQSRGTNRGRGRGRGRSGCNDSGFLREQHRSHPVAARGQNIGRAHWKCGADSRYSACIDARTW